MNTICFTTSFIVIILMSLSSATVDIIVDSDFGGAIDDTFALAYLLKKQAKDNTFNTRLINLVGRNATARAVILSKFLELTGYSQTVDIGIGISTECGDFYSIGCVGPTWPWMEQFGYYSLDDYTGTVYEDGVARMIEIIEEYSPENPIYIVILGAFTNFAEIVTTRPDLRENIRLFIMCGSLFSSTEPFGHFAEFNILDDIDSAQIVFNDRDVMPYYGDAICAVPWDTGYYFQIEGEQYQRLLDGMNDDLLIYHTIKMYEIWYANGGYAFDVGRIYHPDNETSSMYDLEAVWLAAYVAGLDVESEDLRTCESVDYLTMREFDVEVNETGHLYPIDGDEIGTAPPVYFAANWTQHGLANIAKEIVDVLLYCDSSDELDELDGSDEQKTIKEWPFVYQDDEEKDNGKENETKEDKGNSKNRKDR